MYFSFLLKFSSMFRVRKHPLFSSPFMDVYTHCVQLHTIHLALLFSEIKFKKQQQKSRISFWKVNDSAALSPCGGWHTIGSLCRPLVGGETLEIEPSQRERRPVDVNLRACDMHLSTKKLHPPILSLFCASIEYIKRSISIPSFSLPNSALHLNEIIR